MFVPHLGRLSQPHMTVNFEIPGEEGICNMSLICAVENAGLDVTYTWISWEDGADTAHEGSILRAFWRPGDKVASYTCRASNPVSNITSRPIQAGSFCAGTGVPETAPEPLKGLRVTTPLEPNPSRRDFTPGLGRGLPFPHAPSFQRSLLVPSRLRLLPRSQPLRFCE